MYINNTQVSYFVHSCELFSLLVYVDALGPSQQALVMGFLG